MKVNSITAPVSTTTQRAAGTRDEAGPSPAQTAATQEMQSSGLGRALAQSSDVDMGKVNEIRAAISEGKLSLDPDILAEAVMDLHQS